LLATGFVGGITTAVVIFFYSLYFFSDNHQLISYSALATQKLIVIAIALVAMVVLVGNFRALYDKDARERARSLAESEELRGQAIAMQKRFIYTLANAIGGRSGEDSGHLMRVAEVTQLLAAHLGYENTDLIYYASMLHDIGKLKVPYEIINKPGKLTVEEFEQVKLHTVYGYEMLSEANGEVMRLARLIAFEHHERWDGKGYPNGFRAEQISPVARIVSVADVFDALVNRRCYKPAWSMQQAKDYVISGAGSQFDPKVVEVFTRAFLEIEDIYEHVPPLLAKSV
jgi:HD-GYP domain-containing protein (c-di-GMP phosphodiesterase class II)